MGLPALDGYKINQEFASGGMAKIYDATQVSLDRPVAIKFLSKKLLTHHEAINLFEHESLIIARLHHPNIVQVYDKGISEESQPYFVMEKINGIDLDKMLSTGELPFSKKIDIAIQISKGLAYAHKNGVIHRDIKPSNIIIDQHGNAKILDFGIALNAVEETTNDKVSSVLGTDGYVAPEQKNDYSQATVVSDIFSFGVVLFDLFAKPNSQKLGKTSERRLPKQLDKQLKQLMIKCCEPLPEHRYESLSDVRDELLRISQGSHLGQNNIENVEKENRDLANNFNLLDVLSQTQCKRVYLFQKKSNKQLLVIRRSIGDLTGLKEAKLLCSLKHPNIVNVMAAANNKRNVTIISEYLPGGSLSAQLIQVMSEQDFLPLACKMVAGLDYAHQNKILHSNLTPSNILFDDKQNPKLGDFGLPHSSNDDPQAIRVYRPPGQQVFSEQFDIYCLGAIFHHMLFGAPPGYLRNKNTPKITFRLQNLLDQMLALEPLNRPQSTQVVFIELTRIANSDKFKRTRSKIGKAKEVEVVKVKKKRSKPKPQSQDNTLWLSVALTIAIVCIIALIAKDYI